jgi:hypothetical protein
MTTHGVEDRVLGGERQTAGLWTHNGKFVVKGGPVDLPPGSIPTGEIAPNAIQERIGMYAQLVSWTLPTTGVWTETPVQVTAALTGALLRIEFNVLLSCPLKGHRIFYAIMVDGNAPTQSALGALDSPENAYAMMASGTVYVDPVGSGSHRFAFGVAGPAGSQIYNVIASTLYLTEQRR